MMSAPPVEPGNTGLAEEMVRQRESTQPAPVTIEDCQRTLRALGENRNVVDRETHRRQYAFLLGGYRHSPDAGMKLVPVEPTKDMLEIGATAHITPSVGGTAAHKARQVYEAMLSAAPSAKERGGEHTKAAPQEFAETARTETAEAVRTAPVGAAPTPASQALDTKAQAASGELVDIHALLDEVGIPRDDHSSGRDMSLLDRVRALRSMKEELEDELADEMNASIDLKAEIERLSAQHEGEAELPPEPQLYSLARDAVTHNPRMSPAGRAPDNCDVNTWVKRADYDALRTFALSRRADRDAVIEAAAWLVRYGAHRLSCASRKQRPSNFQKDQPCDCGLDDLRKRVKQG